MTFDEWLAVMKAEQANIAKASGNLATLLANVPPQTTPAPTPTPTPTPTEPGLAFPGAVGFGRFSKGGRGGQVIHVTNLNDSGTGSFRAAVTAIGPRIVVFDVAGTINITSRINTSNPYLTIAGETAPSPGIEIFGNSVDIWAPHTIIRHLTFRAGVAGGDNDSFQIPTGTIGPMIFDHCTFQWGGDGTLDLWSDSSFIQNVTIQDCFIFENLVGKNFLVKGAKNVTVFRTFIAYSDERHPRIHSGGTSGMPYIGATEVEMVNCCSYNGGRWGECLMGSDAASPAPVKLSFRRNWYVAGANTDRSTPLVKAKSGAWGTGSAFYFEGNANPDGRTIFVNALGFNPVVSSPPMDSQIPADRILVAGAALEGDVLTKAGARPLNRDAMTARTVTKIKGRTGTNQLSVSGFGGHTPYAQATHVYVAPANPNGDDNGNGWTNIEEDLFAKSAALGA